VNCGASTVLASTNASGHVSVYILGAATNNVGSEPGHGMGAGQIYADGVPMGSFTSPTLDQDAADGGANGVTSLDASLRAQDVIDCGPPGFACYRGRADYSQDGQQTGLDNSLHAQDVIDSTNNLGSKSGCHDGVGPQAFCP
jgi:hypothetical protein